MESGATMSEVSAEKNRVQVVLGLGSNRSLQLEDGSVLSPVQVLTAACKKLKNLLSDFQMSSVYQTKAMYVTDQDDFFNMAVRGTWSGTPEMLLDETQSIEAVLGRDRSKEFRNGPRSLDIDIELFGAQTIDTERLQVPHPRLSERRFILEPMLEILNQSSDKPKRDQFALFLEKLPDQGVRLYGRIEHC